MRYICIVGAAVVLMTACLLTAGWSAQVIAYPSADTWLDRDNPTTNYGNDYYLKTFAATKSGLNYPEKNTLIRFTLPSLGSNYTIHSTSLTLNYAFSESMDSNDIVNVGVYKIQPWAAWTQSGANWNTINGSTYWHSPYGCEDEVYDRYSGLNAWYSFYNSTPGGNKVFNQHLTRLDDTVRSWYAGDTNNGFVLRVYEHVNGQEGVVFYSNNYGSGWGPRLTINYTNRPVAEANGPYTANWGRDVTFSGAGSYDPDGGSIVSYLWDLDDDKEYDDGSGISLVRSYDYLTNTLGLTPGLHLIGLKVIDDEGEWFTDTATLSIGPVPEPASLLALAMGLTGVAAVRRRRAA